MTEETHKELPSIYSYLTGALVLGLIPLIAWVSLTITSILGLDLGATFMATVRVYFTVGFLLLFFPLAIWVEFVYSRWRRRRFRPRNILIAIEMFGAGILIMILISFIFEFAFPNLSFSNEPVSGLAGLAVGLMAGLPALTIALINMIPRVRRHIKRAFEE